MSANGYPPPWGPPGAVREALYFDPYVAGPPKPKQRYWLHALLLLLTLLTTTVVGAGMQQSFDHNQPVDFESDLFGYVHIFHDPAYLLMGLPFSLTLITILLAHEMGHYLAARYYRVDATLPFFLPAPTLIGTLGAFIRIRDRIPSKHALFDIGIGGPLAGFAVLIAPLAIGLSFSKVIPGVAEHGPLIFGTPGLLRLFELVQFPGAGEGDILLHPVARAAWVGLLATALNLLPVGQLDGGHILYAFFGERTRVMTYLVIAGLLTLGGYQLLTMYPNGFSWLIWAALIFFFARRHPSIYDLRPLGKTRTWLGWAALTILILSFTPSPVRT